MSDVTMKSVSIYVTIVSNVWHTHVNRFHDILVDVFVRCFMNIQYPKKEDTGSWNFYLIKLYLLRQSKIFGAT